MMVAQQASNRKVDSPTPQGDGKRHHTTGTTATKDYNVVNLVSLCGLGARFWIGYDTKLRETALRVPQSLDPLTSASFS
jgi:hypothetical protein